MTRILGLAGSLRRDSYNRRLLLNAAALLPGNVEFQLWQGLNEIPPYSEDDDTFPPPPAVERLRRAIAAADAVLIATPEYNGSIPGQLKNAIDWASRPIESTVLRNKPAAVIGTSTGAFGAVWSQAELRKVLKTAGARVIGEEIPAPHADRLFTTDGRLLDESLRRRLADLVAALARESDLSQRLVA